MLRQALVGLAFWLAAWDVIHFPNALRHFTERKTIETPAHMSPGIAVLKSSGQYLIHSHTGNDSELTELGILPARVAN